VTAHIGNTRGNRDPRRAGTPHRRHRRSSSSARPAGRIGGRLPVTVRCHRKPAKGPIQKQRGPGQCRTEATRGHAPVGKPRV